MGETMRFLTTFVALGLAVSPTLASADEVESAITEALESYRAKRPEVAASALKSALQRIRQQQSDQVAHAFPPPLPGWSVKNVHETDSEVPEVGSSVSLGSRLYMSDADHHSMSILMYRHSVTSGERGSRIFIQGAEKRAVRGHSAYLKWKDRKPGAGKHDEEEDWQNRMLIVRVDPVIEVWLVAFRGTSLETLNRYAEAVDYDVLERFSEKLMDE
ncbi:MAG: hypothetical protein K8I02_02285 [Candidatus Methylomirabilis sp.]|nr:hypothetical protein [Deltaproteobacteria bacterium]